MTITMSHYEFLDIRHDGAVEYVLLNRPDVRNAFNDTLIAELHGWAVEMADSRRARAVVLAGAGKTFCAGGDLAWMARAVTFTQEENAADARRMVAMFEALDRLPVPLIGRIHGAALGGGSGLAAVCDVVVAEEQTVFGFTEVKLGLVPGAVSPFVLAKIGRSAARELFVTGARFGAHRAKEIGLVHAVVPLAELDQTVRACVQETLGAGPEAIAGAKQIIRDLWEAEPDRARELAADAIATRRVSAEGQEGLRAFLDKRRASWRKDHE